MNNECCYEYLDIVSDILNNKEFMQIENIKHHNTNRLDHSMKVSYNAYKIAKFLRLDYKEVARAGLLHDFYLDRTKDYQNIFEKVKLFTTKHPNDAIINSLKYYDLTNKELDIIRTHMFPVDIYVPRYLESWIVNLTDSFVSIYEFGFKFKHEISYATNLYLFFLINLIR